MEPRLYVNNCTKCHITLPVITIVSFVTWCKFIVKYVFLTMCC